MELGCPPHPGGESLTLAAAAQHLQVLFADLIATDRREYRDKIKRTNKTKQTDSEQNDDDGKGRVSYQVLKKKEAEIEEILEKMSRSTSSTKSLSAWLCILKAELEEHEQLRRRVYKVTHREKSTFGKTLLELEGSLVAGLLHKQKEKQMKKAATKNQSTSKEGNNLMDELNAKLTRRNSSSQLSYEELVAHFDKSKQRKEPCVQSSEEDDGCKRDDQYVDTLNMVEKEEDEGCKRDDLSVETSNMLEQEEDSGCKRDDLSVDTLNMLEKEEDDGCKRDDLSVETLTVVDKEEEVDAQYESDGCDECKGDEEPAGDTLNVIDKEEDVDSQPECDGQNQRSSSEVEENQKEVVFGSEMVDNHHEIDVLNEIQEDILISRTSDQACSLPDLMINPPNEDTPLSLVENHSLLEPPIMSNVSDYDSMSPTRSLCEDDLRRCLSVEDMFDGKSTTSLSTTWTVGAPVGYGVEYIRTPVFSGSYYEYEKQVASYEEAVARVRREQMQMQKKKALVNVYRLQLQALESECSKEYRKMQELKLELEPLRQITDTWNILQDESLDFLFVPTPTCTYPTLESVPEEKFLVTSQVGHYPNKRTPTYQVSSLRGNK